MRLCAVRDLIAHAGRKLIDASIGKLGAQVPTQAQHDVPLLTPMVSGIVGRVFDHAHAERAEMPRAPGGNAGVTGVLRRCDLRPIGDPERNIGELHAGQITGVGIPYLAQSSLAGPYIPGTASPACRMRTVI